MISLFFVYFKTKNLMARFTKKQDGISAIEYGFVAVAISASIIFIFSKNGSFYVMHDSIWLAVKTVIDNIFSNL